MGLDTSHDCWSGPYSFFYDWRVALADAAGLPPLPLMEGFYNPNREAGWRNVDPSVEKIIGKRADAVMQALPIKWTCLKEDPLHELLFHSDCGGEIPWKSCAGIADSLGRLVSKMGDFKPETRRFIKGLRTASKRKENVIFH